jgi:uncharacterized membrane protein
MMRMHASQLLTTLLAVPAQACFCVLVVRLGCCNTLCAGCLHGVHACISAPHHAAGVLGAGVFVSSWLGGLLLTVGEWIIKKLPLVKHIYSAAKQARRSCCCCCFRACSMRRSHRACNGSIRHATYTAASM